MMIRCLAFLLLAAPGSGPQDAAAIRALVTQLSAEDWVDQAKAAKELARIGAPALDHLAKVTEKDPPSVRYWAEQIRTSVTNAPEPAAAPAPANAPPPSGFTPDETDMGSILFICNNASHGDREVLISRCTTCAKAKRFFYDYSMSPAGFRCGVCKTAYATSALKCDRCYLPPGPRTRIRTKR